LLTISVGEILLVIFLVSNADPLLFDIIMLFAVKLVVPVPPYAIGRVPN